MTPLLSLLVYSTVFTFATVLLGAFLRNREWTLDGLRKGLGNRDDLDEPTPLGGRAQRAAANSIEALLLFTPLVLVAHLAGMETEAMPGAQLFFWARIAYLPVYLAGVIYLRSLIWAVGVVGLAMIVIALL